MKNANVLTATVLAAALSALTPAYSADARLANISARASTGVGDDTLIAGFVIQGSGSKTVLIRGLGPGLIPLKVTGTVEDTSLKLYKGQSVVTSNSHWDSSAATQLLANKVGAYPIALYSKDSAIVASLTEGSYTTHLNAANGAKDGVGLIEVYDGSGSVAFPRFVNVSIRARGGPGDGTLIGGLVIDGKDPVKILARGIGPGLAQFGLTQYMQDPNIVVYDNHGNPLASNDNWATASSPDNESVSQTSNRVGAFPLSQTSKDAAVSVVRHQKTGAESSTIHVNGTGDAVLEIYDAN